MKLVVRYCVAAASVALLVGCGGGGGDEAPAGQPGGPAHPLQKYVGTYSQCDQDHTRYSLVFTEIGNGTFGVMPTEVTYQNADCSGTVLGSYGWTAPARVTHLAAGTVTVSGGVLPPSLTIDTIRIAALNVVPTLSGPAVTNNCIAYPTGQLCYQMTPLNQTTDGGFYLDGPVLYGLQRENGSYFVDSVYTRD